MPEEQMFVFGDDQEQLALSRGSEVWALRGAIESVSGTARDLAEEIDADAVVDVRGAEKAAVIAAAIDLLQSQDMMSPTLKRLRYMAKTRRD